MVMYDINTFFRYAFFFVDEAKCVKASLVATL
jgi:hypothetical protein